MVGRSLVIGKHSGLSWRCPGVDGWARRRGCTDIAAVLLSPRGRSPGRSLPGAQLPPRGPDPRSAEGRSDRHPVHGNELVQVQPGQGGDVPDGCLGGPERAERRGVVNGPGPRHVRQFSQLRGLIQHVPGGSKLALMDEDGDLEVKQRNVYAPVDRVEVAEDRSGKTTSRRRLSAACSSRWDSIPSRRVPG